MTPIGIRVTHRPGCQTYLGFVATRDEGNPTITEMERRRVPVAAAAAGAVLTVGTRLAAVTYGWNLPTAQNLDLQRE